MPFKITVNSNGSHLASNISAQVVNFGVLGVMRNVRSDHIGHAMFCKRYGFPFLSDTLSHEQHMLYADSSPVSGGSVFIKGETIHRMYRNHHYFGDGSVHDTWRPLTIQTI